MNIDPDDPTEWHLDMLFSAARAAKPDTSRSEYGFETRLLARIAAHPPKPPLWWAAWSWRLAPLFTVVALSLSLWTRFAPGVPAVDDPARAALEWSASAEDDLGGLVLDDFWSPS